MGIALRHSLVSNVSVLCVAERGCPYMLLRYTLALSLHHSRLGLSLAGG